MKKTFALLLIASFWCYSGYSQDDYFSLTKDGTKIKGEARLNGIPSSSEHDKNDILGGLNKKTSSGGIDDRGGSRYHTPLEGNYDGPSSEVSWGENDTYSNELYKRMKNHGNRYNKDAGEALSILAEVNSLLSADCIDINFLHNVYVRFKRLSSFQRSVLGYEGDKALAELVARLENAKPFYDKYSILALDIKSNSFSKVDKEIMHQNYEELNGYLRQFLSKEEFDRAKIEYGKYEKDETVKKVYEKVKLHEMQKKNNNTMGANNHLALQRIRKKEKQFRPSYITINNPSSNGTSREWEEVSMDVMEKAMEKFFKPLKEHIYNLGSDFTGLTKRLVNFTETYPSITFSFLEADKKALQAVLRGENPDPIVIKAQHEGIDKTYKGTINSF